ncbi:hypothetical protein [Bdellovibrio svalbardensis]|uniref:Peptidase M11 gametolysin domain-containing protein n=1 Tax=Bdellovibrio svalbardensis TaxID=2972972 RepID=A0ABT6DFC8_9BACT|nr:hypothetical protein [Bdellovibrio svalbardensis]MDG0815550.1 hypothetical protein [Bdellovibrio svalbardensis]
MNAFRRFLIRAYVPIAVSLLALPLSSSAATSTLGVQNILVFLINFQDMPTSQPFTAAQATDVMFGSGLSVANFYRENSYGQTSLTGKVAGWYTIPMSSTSSCDTAKIASYAQQSAIAAGINLNTYNRFLYVAPGNSNCGNWGGSQAAAYDGPFVVNFNVGIVSHEIGHDFGLNHAHGMNCDAGTLSGNCPWLEYGDVLDTMGGGNGTSNGTVYNYHFNAAQKEKLGWLNSNSSSLITTVTVSGFYTIEPFESLGTKSKALKILKSVDPVSSEKTYYYLEYRQPIGFDSGLNNFGSFYDLKNIFGGVTLHQGSSDAVFLLDMTPGSRSSGTFDDLRDGALVVGQNYIDSAAGISLSVVSASSLGLTVNITLTSPCTRANPTVTISPSTQTALAGTALNYAVSIKNNDSGECGTSTFNLQSALLNGFNSTFTSPSLSINAGSSASATLTVTSSTSVLSGSYSFSATATNSSATAYKASGAAAYIVGSSSTKGGGKGGRK